MLFAFSLAIYVATMSRGITWLNSGHDGGDFISAARAFGVPHPTGYPSYTLLLRVFGDVVAIGDHAFRGNLLSALLGALSVPFVYVAALRLLRMLPVREVGGNRSLQASAVIAALSFATSRLFWSQSTITEVYTLNALFGAVLLVLALGVVRDLNDGRSAIKNRTVMTLLLGLGLGNHTTLGLAAAPFGIWVLWLIWKQQRWRGVLDWRPAVGLLAGLSVYAYVPIVASTNPMINWGSADSVEGFRWMISATIYQQAAFGLSNELLPGRISAIAEMLFTQYTVIGTVIGIAGLTSIWNFSRAFVVASLASVLSIAVYAIAYDTADSFVYLISAFMVFSLWLAVGTAVLGQGIGRYAARSVRLAGYRARLYLASFVLVALAVPLWSLVMGWDDVDLSNKNAPADFIESTIEMAAGGIVLAEEPQLFALVYQAQVAGPEHNVMVVGPNMLQHDWYWDQLVEFHGDRMPSERPDEFTKRFQWLVGLNLGSVPIYSTHNDRPHHDELTLVPEGDLYRVEF
jgi:hypothetical protein